MKGMKILAPFSYCFVKFQLERNSTKKMFGPPKIMIHSKSFLSLKISLFCTFFIVVVVFATTSLCLKFSSGFCPLFVRLVDDFLHLFTSDSIDHQSKPFYWSSTKGTLVDRTFNHTHAHAHPYSSPLNSINRIFVQIGLSLEISRKFVLE